MTTYKPYSHSSEKGNKMGTSPDTEPKPAIKYVDEDGYKDAPKAISPTENTEELDELRHIFPKISKTQRYRLKRLIRNSILGSKFDTSDSTPAGELRRNKVKNGYRVEILQRLDTTLKTKEKTI